MKTNILLGIVLVLCACGTRKKHLSETSENTIPAGCKDTTATMVFINKKTVELNVHILKESNAMEGGVMVHTYTKYKQVVVRVGDSTTVILPAKRGFLYDVYGPVSINVNGQGVVASKKFELLPCRTYREIL